MTVATVVAAPGVCGDLRFCGATRRQAAARGSGGDAPRSGGGGVARRSEGREAVAVWAPRCANHGAAAALRRGRRRPFKVNTEVQGHMHQNWGCIPPPPTQLGAVSP